MVKRILCIIVISVLSGAGLTVRAQSALTLPDETLLIDPVFARPGYGGLAQPFLRRTRYLLALDVDTARGRLIGKARILYVNNSPLTQDRLALRLYPNHPTHQGRTMTIAATLLNGAPLTGQFQDADNTVFVVPLTAAIPVGGTATLDIDYTISLPGTGFYYIAEPYPIVAVADSSGWRTEVATKGLDYAYTENALHAVRLRVPGQVATWFVGMAKSVEPQPDGTIIYTIVTGSVKNFILIQANGWVSQDFPGASVPIRVLYFNNAQAVEQTGQIAVQAFNFFERAFGEYPYAEFDIVSMNFPSGGEEYPGIVFIHNQRDFTYRRFIVAHEVAHQWFYGLAGNDTMRHAWLDESLVQIAGYLFYKKTGYGAPNAAEAFWQSILTWYNRVQVVRPINTPLDQYRDFSDYMSTTYGAGPVFFREVAEKIGEDAFLAGLRAYVTSAYLGTGTPELFFNAIQSQTAVNLQPLFCQRVGIAC
jgi:hypothetical protein